MHIRRPKFRIGPRTIKTAAAACLSMTLVSFYGLSTSKLIFAMLGAVAAVQPTFRESAESCLTQIIGMTLGAMAGVLLMALPIPGLLAASAGIVAVITLYNAMGIHYSPSMACLIVVVLCTTPDIQPLEYALWRLWDTAIGLGMGMLINILILPYDNSQRIRSAAEGLHREPIAFLQDLFDGDDHMPDPVKMENLITSMAGQLQIFEKQRLLLRLRRQHRQIQLFWQCERQARALLAQMEVLSRLGASGGLTPENRQRLENAGVILGRVPPADPCSQRDVVTNYHVAELLTLRQELLEILKSDQK